MRALAACTCPGYWLTIEMMVALLGLATLALLAMVVLLVWLWTHD